MRRYVMDNTAPFLEMPNDKKLPAPKPMFYGNQRVPTPCNHAAKHTDASAVMRAVNEGK